MLFPRGSVFPSFLSYVIYLSYMVVNEEENIIQRIRNWANQQPAKVSKRNMLSGLGCSNIL